MVELSVTEAPKNLRTTATYATAVLHALAREEARERKPRRLLEPGLATWVQFRGRLGATDLLELVLEDASVTQPTSFTAPADLDLPALPPTLVDQWLRTLGELDLSEPGPDYVTAQARRLGVATRMARSDLHRVRPEHQILELPGSGGQLAHHLVTSHDDVFLQNNFTIACRDFRDATLAAVVAVELGVSGPAPVTIDPELRAARSATFDYVVGLDPDKGGDFRAAQLAEWFPRATVLLV